MPRSRQHHPGRRLQRPERGPHSACLEGLLRYHSRQCTSAAVPEVVGALESPAGLLPKARLRRLGLTKARRDSWLDSLAVDDLQGLIVDQLIVTNTFRPHMILAL